MKNYIAFYQDTTDRGSVRTFEANDLTEACYEAEAFADDETTLQDVREREGWLEYRLYATNREKEDLEFALVASQKSLDEARQEVRRQFEIVRAAVAQEREL